MRSLLFLSLIMIFSVAYNNHAYAREAIIRDAEIEANMRIWTKDIFSAAGMKQSQVNLVLVQSSDVNAFVAGGANIFIYSGLIQKTENAGEVAGVIAHELGHISGGHLTRTGNVAKNASFEAIIGAVVGIGAAIATGDSSAAAAGIAIGQGQAMNGFLAYSRVQEASADQAGFRFLSGANINPEGLPSFLEKLASQEMLPTSNQSSYVRTHPLSRDRVDLLENKVETSPLKNKKLPPEWNDQYARVKAKLAGFITPQQVAFLYPSSDVSVPARYARAIAYYRNNDFDSANHEIGYLLKLEPKNPYFWELQGQILFGSGDIKTAINSYKRAVQLAPSSGLIRVALAQAMVEDGENLNDAINHLKRAERDEPRVAMIKRLLATAYGKIGREAEARVFLAEEALMHGKKAEAIEMAKSVVDKLPKSSPEQIRASDIINHIGD